MEALLGTKAHASPAVKGASDVVLDMAREDAGEAAAAVRPGVEIDEPADVKKGHTAASPGSTLPEFSRVALCGLVLGVVGILLAIFYMLPPLVSVDEGDKFLWRPRSASDFELDKRVLVRYRNEHAWQLVVGMAVMYIALQTFCVPASGTTMNVLAGCIFSETLPSGEYLIALPMAVLCVSMGAVLCYLISFLSLRELVTVGVARGSPFHRDCPL
jgi:hypothetical protein